MGTDKALMEIEGQPLLRRVARRLAEVADPVLLAPGPDTGRLAGVGGLEGLPMVADAAAGAGPLGAIVAGLRASPHRVLAVVAVDMPDLCPALLRAMGLGWRPGVDVRVPVTAAGPQPLHAIWARGALPALEGALREGRLALREALAGLRIETWPEGRWRSIDPAGAFARNLNTPEDLLAH